jgi:predicted nucleic acid-binding protein
LKCLLDTSILVRYANAGDAQHGVAVRGVDTLLRRGDALFITGQNLIEFWSVATRPRAVNGLGLSIQEVVAHITAFEASFALAEDRPSIVPEWKRLAESLNVVGKQVHDVRLVAVCHVHGLDHLLSFNVGHFARFTVGSPALKLLDPASI